MLQRLLGHSTQAMTSQYVKLVTEDLSKEQGRTSILNRTLKGLFIVCQKNKVAQKSSLFIIRGGKNYFDKLKIRFIVRKRSKNSYKMKIKCYMTIG